MSLAKTVINKLKEAGVSGIEPYGNSRATGAGGNGDEDPTNFSIVDMKGQALTNGALVLYQDQQWLVGKVVDPNKVEIYIPQQPETLKTVNPTELQKIDMAQSA